MTRDFSQAWGTEPRFFNRQGSKCWRDSGVVAYQDDILAHASTDVELRKNSMRWRSGCRQKTSPSRNLSAFRSQKHSLSSATKSQQKESSRMPHTYAKNFNFSQLRMWKKLSHSLVSSTALVAWYRNMQLKLKLRQKETNFKWTEQCQRAFQSLVDELSREPIVSRIHSPKKWLWLQTRLKKQLERCLPKRDTLLSMSPASYPELNGIRATWEWKGWQ